MNIEVNVKERKYIMPLPKCYYCAHEEDLDLRTYGYYKGPVTCGQCKKRYYIEFGNITDTVLWDGPGPGGQLLSPIRPVGNPDLLEGLQDLPIPESVLKDFEDASHCVDYGIPRAAAVMCRSAVQGALLEKGVPDKAPQDMVNKARNEDILSETVKHLCMAAVFLGGKGGHPQIDWTDEIGHREAQQALLVTHRVLMELFPSLLDDIDDLPF